MRFQEYISVARLRRRLPVLGQARSLNFRFIVCRQHDEFTRGCEGTQVHSGVICMRILHEISVHCASWKSEVQKTRIGQLLSYGGDICHLCVRIYRDELTYRKSSIFHTHLMYFHSKIQD